MRKFRNTKPKPNLPELCAAVRRIREARGWSQERMARETNIATQTISRFELGKAEPRDYLVLSSLADAAAAAGLDAEKHLFRQAAGIIRIWDAPQQDPPWTPFEAAEIPPEIKALGDTAIFINSRYQVNVRILGEKPPFGFMAHLSIKRRDKAPIRNWRDLQRIKNEICGEHCEAVEIFPAEGRLVDTSNQYHLWVFREYVLPFGFQDGRVISDIPKGNSVQEPFEERPPDCNAREVDLREIFSKVQTYAAIKAAEGIAKK